MRSQLRAGLTAFAVLAAVFGALPLLFAALPADPGPWPSLPALVWLVLGVAAYPALLAVGHWYVRRAERNERDFADLTEGP
jgi:multisubunit Na+/H+ antiporter MnhB subunit